MGCCAICGIDFAANVKVVAKLKLHASNRSTVGRWLFCENCYPKLRIVLERFTFIPATAYVIATEKKE